ncbi:MAG TPA: response regulator [Thiothrix sp.]|nr:response regulator [Thiothrix sp.]
MDTKKPLIFIVDDEPIFLELLEGLLEDDYNVRTANCGIEALQKVLEEPLPDLIFLDLVMPDISGVVVCKQLKQNPRLAHIPVLFFTANRDIEDEVSGFEAGAVDYIHKPLSPPLLLARMRTHLELKAAHEAVSKQKTQLEQLLEIRSKELEQARSLAFNWVETVVSNKSEERSRFYLDSLKENLGLPNGIDIQQLLHQTTPSTEKQDSPANKEPPKRELIEQQLELILNSKGFSMAKRMRGLLRFIVKETLDGHASTLKAFTIAVEVFQRDERFDPQQDPLIRVQAGNLRKRLEQYYLTDGREDNIIINIPKGSYGAVFSIRS